MKAALFALIVLLGTTGCAALVEGLRRDLDDEPFNEPAVIGGKYAERGFLASSNGEMSVYGDRGPASAGSSARERGRSWVTQERADSNRRDRFRGAQEEPEQADDMVTSGNTASMRPTTMRQYKNGARATRSDFIDEAPNEGSLWGSDGQTNYYFTKNKIRGVGDIVTINIEDTLVRDTALEVRRGLTPREREAELILAQSRIAERFGASKDSVASSSSAPERAPAAVGAAASTEKKPAYANVETPSDKDKELPMPTLSDIDLTKTLEVKAGETMLAEIVERYPNGNYKVRGTKRIPYKNGAPRIVTVTAVAKGTDFSEDDVITSGKLYEYRIEAVR